MLKEGHSGTNEERPIIRHMETRRAFKNKQYEETEGYMRQK